jgi:hypothetical protein
MGDAGDMTVLPKIHETGNGGKQKNISRQNWLSLDTNID